MAEELTASAQPEKAAEGPSSDALEVALREKFGDEVGLDDFETYMKREEGWLQSRNEKQEALAQAEREAQAARDAALQSVTQSQAALQAQQAAAQGNQNRPLTDEELLAVLGASGSGDVASAGQLVGVYRSMEKTFQDFGNTASQVVAAQQARINELEGQIKNVEPYFDGMHQYLAEQKRDELLSDFKYADKSDIENAMRTLPSGPDFENQLRGVAEQSHKRHLAIGQEAMKEEVARRNAAKAQFRGEGATAALAGEGLPSMSTRDGIKDFASKTFDAGDSEI